MSLLVARLMQAVSKAPHIVPAMNATNRQTITALAAVAAIDRFLSGTGVRIDEDCAQVLRVMQDSTSHASSHTAMFSFLPVEALTDTGRISLS